MVIVLVNEGERVEDFTLADWLCVKDDLSKLEAKVEDSEELTKGGVAFVFVWELSTLVSAVSVESGEFEEVDDKRPEETSEDDRELEEKEVDEMGRI